MYAMIFSDTEASVIEITKLENLDVSFSTQSLKSEQTYQLVC